MSISVLQGAKPAPAAGGGGPVLVTVAVGVAGGAYAYKNPEVLPPAVQDMLVPFLEPASF